MKPPLVDSLVVSTPFCIFKNQVMPIDTKLDTAHQRWIIHSEPNKRKWILICLAAIGGLKGSLRVADRTYGCDCIADSCANVILLHFYCFPIPMLPTQ